MLDKLAHWYREGRLGKGIIQGGREAASIYIASHSALHALQFLDAIFLSKLVSIILIDDGALLVSTAHQVFEHILLVASCIYDGALHFLLFISGVRLGVDIVDAQEIDSEVEHLLSVCIGRDDGEHTLLILCILFYLRDCLLSIFIEDVIEYHLHISLPLVGKVLALGSLHAITQFGAIEHERLCLLHQAQLFETLGNLSLLTEQRNLILHHVIDNLLLYLAGDAILVGSLKKYIVLHQESHGTLHLLQYIIVLLGVTSIRTGNIIHRGTSIRLSEEVDDLQEFLATDQLETTICGKMLFRLLITHAERLRDILHRLVAKFHGRYMGMHLFLRHRLLLQHIEHRHQHASCTNLGGYRITGTKEEILEHLKLMHEEWVIVRIDLTILGGTEGKTRDIGYCLYHTTVLGIVSLQLLLTSICLVEQTLTDNLVYLFCRYWNASLEASLHFFELALVES